MSLQYNRLKEWRRNTKQKLVEALGSQCQICTYNKCNSALDFHHIDPAEKDFSISSCSKNAAAWDKIIQEVKKCILLCSNCHRELHDGLIKLPKNYQKFDESLIVSFKEKPEDTPCNHCKKLKCHRQKFCSHACAVTFNAKLNLTKEQVLFYLEKHNNNMSAISRELGISANGFKKKCIKYQVI